MITRAGAADAMEISSSSSSTSFPLITDVVIGAALTAVLGSSGEKKEKDNEKRKNLIPKPGGFVT
jgi:hypothetical protein